MAILARERKMERGHQYFRGRAVGDIFAPSAAWQSACSGLRDLVAVQNVNLLIKRARVSVAVPTLAHIITAVHIEDMTGDIGSHR